MNNNAAIGAVMLAATLACGVRADAPPRIDIDRTACGHCGMLISETAYAAAYQTPGAQARVFDDIGCLLEAIGREEDPALARLWFHDAAGTGWIEGEAAVFVRSPRLRTPMGGGLVAYRDGQAAERSAADRQGRVIRGVRELMADAKGGGS
jgi:copper chaperone NosL